MVAAFGGRKPLQGHRRGSLASCRAERGDRLALAGDSRSRRFACALRRQALPLRCRPLSHVDTEGVNIQNDTLGVIIRADLERVGVDARFAASERVTGKDAMIARTTLRFAAIGAVCVALASCASLPTHEDANNAVLTLQQYRRWAWAIGIALIWADLLLPVPQTAVIAALGIVYGTVIGGVLGSVGQITGGLLGYLVMRTALRGFVKRFIGPRRLEKMEGLFDRAGAWAIVLTRSLPYSIPEALVFLAGIAGMTFGKFLAALAVGSVPTAFAFAAIGAGWADEPVLALAASYVLPILLLPVVLYLLRRRPK
jgi:uncharacterized membrane protein YdjX (TVP38/TMEM64 family)